MNVFNLFKGKKEKKDDLLRENIENIIKLYIEAGHYLSSCGTFNKEKFEQVENIFSRSSDDSMDEPRRSKIKNLINSLSTQNEIIPWDQVKVVEIQTGQEAIILFCKLLLELYPDDQSRKFIKWTRNEIEKIMKS